MGMDGKSRKNSQALRAAYTQRHAWQARLEEAESVDDANGMREAVKFIAEYDYLIAELEKQAAVG